MLTIVEHRCVHTRAAIASCRGCVDACPRSAWAMSARAVVFAAKSCDECGLCVPACPTGALSLDPHSGFMPKRGQVQAALACDKVDHEFPRTADTQRVACVQAIGESQLLAGYENGLRVLEVATAQCRQCPRGIKPALEERAERVNRALATRGRPPLRLRWSIAQWRKPTHGDVGMAPASSRRRLLLGLPSTPLRSTAQQSGDRREAAAVLDRLGAGDPLWAVRLEPARCDACLACARLCPAGAISFEGTASAPGVLVIDNRRCVGCALCADACAGEAIRVDATEAVAATIRFELTRVRCTRCGDAYNRSSKAEAERRCPACAARRGGRQNRIVETGPSVGARRRSGIP